MLLDGDLEATREMIPAAKPRFVVRHRGVIFLCCVFIAFMQAGFFAARRHFALHEFRALMNWSPLLDASVSKSVVTEHPIAKLMVEAELNFRRKLAAQSKTYNAAVKEYKRRYRRDPPKGFDDWWKFAQENHVKMVDEYDGLMEDLDPFWAISGEELRRRALQVGYLPSIDLVRVRQGTAKIVNINKGFVDPEVSARSKGLVRMMEKFQHTLPDLDLPVNAKAEGRVLVPWEHRQYPDTILQDSSAGIESMLGGPFRADWQEDGSTWEAFRKTCNPNSSARRLFSSFRDISSIDTKRLLGDPSSNSSDGRELGGDFHFCKTTEAKSDFCQAPWARYTQGHFFSDWRTIPTLYPILSPAKAPGFMDIRIPSHYYYGSTPRYTYGWDPVNLEVKEVDDMEVPWEDKLSKIFWRGATTGGGSHPPGYAAHYHRHRFLKMSNDQSDTNRTVVFEHPPASSRYAQADVPIQALNEEIMDTAFVTAVDDENYPGGLKAMKEDLHFGDAVPLGKHWSYKFLIDLDGMSYSGRFMAFLASDSVPIKSTIYHEYFSDWIEPWLHFIPLSSSYKEIYNIHAFFAGPTNAALRALDSSPRQEESLQSPQPLQPSQPPPGSPPLGDRLLRRLARAGKQWKKTIGRTVDMEAYVYRLCLEYARLSSDDRQSMTMHS